MWSPCRKGCGGYVEDAKEHKNCEKEQRFPDKQAGLYTTNRINRVKRMADDKYFVGDGARKK